MGQKTGRLEDRAADSTAMTAGYFQPHYSSIFGEKTETSLRGFVFQFLPVWRRIPEGRCQEFHPANDQKQRAGPVVVPLEFRKGEEVQKNCL